MLAFPKIKKMDFSSGQWLHRKEKQSKTKKSKTEKKESQKKKEKKSCYFTSLGSVSACCVSQQREEKGQSLNLARCLAGSQLEPSTQGSILPSLACPTTPPPRFTLTASRQGSRAHINSAHCHGGRLCQGKNVVLGDGVGRGSLEKK